MKTAQKPIYKKWWFWVLSVFVFLLIIGIFAPKKEKPTADTNGQIEQTEEIVKEKTPEELEAQRKKDSAMEYTSVENVINDINKDTERMKPYIKSAIPGDHAQTIYPEIKRLQVKYNSYDRYAYHCLTDEQTNRYKQAMKDYEVTLKKVLKKNYPALRAVYAMTLRNNLWENDVEVEIKGSRKDILTFTGGVFATNKNIKDMQAGISSDVNKFRFKRIQYKWYSGDRKIPYYDLDNFKDDEIDTSL